MSSCLALRESARPARVTSRDEAMAPRCGGLVDAETSKRSPSTVTVKLIETTDGTATSMSAANCLAKRARSTVELSDDSVNVSRSSIDRG